MANKGEIRGGRNNPLLGDDSIAQHRHVQTPETPEFRGTLCRYESNKLVKARKFLGEIEYVAISYMGYHGMAEYPRARDGDLGVTRESQVPCR